MASNPGNFATPGGIPVQHPLQTQLDQAGQYPSSQQAGSNINVPVSAPSLSAQEFLSKVPMKPLSSFHEWSDKLTKENKEVPLDTKVYETMIQKDAMFLAEHSKQSFENKMELESLSKDLQQYNMVKQLRMNSIQLSAKNQLNNSIWGEGYQGYGNGVTNTGTKLLLPPRDYTDRMINERLMRQDKQLKNYVPIRLEFDQERDQFKLRDTFLWDLNEEVLSVEDFTTQLLEDYKFIPKVHYHTILSSIKEQIADYQQKPIKTTGELRIPIKIDIIINNTQLTDQFEWDILNNGDLDPEEFATMMSDELYLPGEFATVIAHSIREQSQMYLKALNLAGYAFDGTPVTDDSVRNHLLPALRLVSKDYQVVDDFFSILRNPSNVSDYCPQLIKLTEMEVERMDKELERESRRKRRHNYNEDAQALFGSGGAFGSGSGGFEGRGGSSGVGGGGGGIGIGLGLGLGSGGGGLGGGNSFSSSNDRGSVGSRGLVSSRRAAAHTGRGTILLDLSDVPRTFRTPAPSSILPGGVDLGVPDVYEYNEVVVKRLQVKNPDYRPPTPEPVASDLVTYHHDPIEGTFNVTIKLLD